jgi:outer membrane protein OmpA-like peptidoglycan-associated protein
MKSTRRLTVYALALCLLPAAVNAFAAQPVKESLFRETELALKAARAAQAQLLAPRSYEKAMKYYNSAKSKFDRGKNLDSIRSDLTDATQYFQKAATAAQLAAKELGPLVKTRDDAAKVNAAQHAPDLWGRAEENFSKAMIELERGAREPAEQRAQEADKYYRDAELASIKATYLNDTRQLIAKAEKEKVDKYAPRTLQKSKNLLQKAEQALIQNRYDTDLPRSLAQQAKYEAKHAMYLASAIREARAQKLTHEQLILEWERPVEQIAAAADMKAEFDKGYQKPTDKIVLYIDEQQVQAQRAGQDVNDLQGEITQLHAQVAQMRRQLGGVAEERVVLSEQLESQLRARQQVEQVEHLFTRNEARVLRESSDVIIRLVGLSFDVGQANIDPKNFQLLSKVQNAIRTFPNSKLVIEGHTDSYGSDTANYALSQQRAEAVKAYILANMRIDPTKVSAVGYGETRPIANNETTEGRAKNRRIDVVIRGQ